MITSRSVQKVLIINRHRSFIFFVFFERKVTMSNLQLREVILQVRLQTNHVLGCWLILFRHHCSKILHRWRREQLLNGLTYPCCGSLEMHLTLTKCTCHLLWCTRMLGQWGQGTIFNAAQIRACLALFCLSRRLCFIQLNKRGHLLRRVSSKRSPHKVVVRSNVHLHKEKEKVREWRRPPSFRKDS